MPSEKQVRDWIVECLRRQLSPDALGVEPCVGDELLLVYTRAPGTKDQYGPTFTVTVSK